MFLNGNAQVFWDRPACRLRASWSNLLSIVAQAFIENEATVDEMLHIRIQWARHAVLALDASHKLECLIQLSG